MEASFRLYNVREFPLYESTSHQREARMPQPPRRLPYDVMVAGHLCLDISPQFGSGRVESVSELLQPGKLVHVGPVTLSAGGAVANTGGALRRLGNRVCCSARVGADGLGRLVLGLLEREGIGTGVRVTSRGSTSYTVVLAPAGVDRMFLHHPGGNDDYRTSDVNLELVRLCRLFHFGYPPLMRRMYERGGAEFATLLRRVRRCDVVTSCDMALPDPASPAGVAPWREILTRSLPFVDLFLPSVDEALYALDPQRFLSLRARDPDVPISEALDVSDYRKVALDLLALGCKVVGLKAGRRGWYLRTARDGRGWDVIEAARGETSRWRGRELWVPAFRAARIVSATGAGDTSIAGFLTAFLKGYPPEACLRVAVCVGWQNLQALDALSGIRSWSETQRLLQQRLPCLPAGTFPKGWVWRKQEGVWSGPEDAVRS